jgi:cytochrome c oxidase subunit 1
MHGTTMIFLVIVPILAGFGNFLVPLMIGARDMAFPRLNALSYWLFLGRRRADAELLGGRRARARRLDDVHPLSTLHMPGKGPDLWILGLHILTISSLVGAINFVGDDPQHARAGHELDAHPALLLDDRHLRVAADHRLADPLGGPDDDAPRPAGGHELLQPGEGGSPILYQHVFWFFGHPEVYIMILPAMGIVSEILPVFARKADLRLQGDRDFDGGIAFYSMLVWAHHMFAVGLPTGLDSFFMISSMIIAVPTGVKIFNWLATLWRGNISFDTPMLWAVGFIGVFTFGGCPGSSSPRSRSTGS